MCKTTLKSSGIGKDDIISHINDGLNPNDQHLGSAPSTGNGHLNPIDEQKVTVPKQSPDAEQEPDYPYQIATVKAKDLRNIRFLANNSILVGDKIITFAANMCLYSAFPLIGDDLRYAKEDEEVEIWGHLIVEVVNPKSIINTAKTFHEMFSHALDSFLKTKDLFPRKVNGEDDSMFDIEIFDLQDAFHFAIRDWSRFTNPEDAFNVFTAQLGYWWPADYCGVPEALEMLHEFFDRYYPTVANKM